MGGLRVNRIKLSDASLPGEGKYLTNNELCWALLAFAVSFADLAGTLHETALVYVLVDIHIVRVICLI